MSCFHYEHGNKPQIEVAKIDKSESMDLAITENEIVFIIEGQIQFRSDNSSACEGTEDSLAYEVTEGKFIFFPTASHYTSLQAVKPSVLIVFRLTGAANLCENFRIEQLYNMEEKTSAHPSPVNKWFYELNIKPRLWPFLNDVQDYLSDNVKCRCLFEIKTKELLLLLRAYYTKEELHDFFLPILSSDTTFSEYVRQHWQDFHTVRELADAMQLTHKQFYSRFVAVFGKAPQQWMMEGRANILYREITTTNKQFKQIALENGFSSDTQFTHFCKKMLRRTPTEIRKNKTFPRGDFNK